MILFSDLHLKPESAETCFSVLDAILSLAKARGEKVIAFLGDFWHVRYSVPVDLLNRVDAELDRWMKEGIEEVILLPGNHDQINVAGENALKILERAYPEAGRVEVYDEPIEDAHGLWLPYRKDPMQIVERIVNVPHSAKRAFIHHGLVGAQMNTGIAAGELDGIHPGHLVSFQTVFFGHWHRHQVLGNCVYVGSPWQTKADEAGQQKGVIVLDEKTGAWEFVPLTVGKKYIRATTAAEAAQAKAGDTVRLPYDCPQDIVNGLLKRGIEARVDPPPFVPTTARLGLDKNTPMRAYAERYVEAQHGDLDKSILMQIFDEVSHG